MERVTTPEPFQSHPDSREYAMFFDGLHHVFGTGGKITAGGGQKRRNAGLVALQYENQERPHRSKIRPTSRHSSGNGASSALRRGLKTTAQLSGRAAYSCRTASRILRFNRFRWTALPRLRGTVNPNREGAASPRRRQNATKKRLVMRTPF